MFKVYDIERGNMMGNNSQKKVTKKDRANQRKNQAKKKMLIKQIGVISGVILIIAAIVFIVVEKQKPLPGQAVEIMKNQDHIESVDSQHTPYNSDPPTSGQHVETMANWGVHTEPVAKELLVHNLEDGGIVIYYNDDVDNATLEKLEKLVEGYSDKVLLNPYPEMGNSITVTAWGRIDRLDQFNKEQLTTFIQAFRGKDHH